MHHLKCWADIFTSKRDLKHNGVVKENSENNMCTICVAWGHWGKFSKEWFVNI